LIGAITDADAPELTVLVAACAVLNANFGQSRHGVFTKRAEALTNDFFVNLLDMGTTWKAASEADDVFEVVIAQPANSSGPAPCRSHLRSNSQLRHWRKSTDVRTPRRSSCTTS